MDTPLALIQSHRCPDVLINKCLRDTRLGLMEFFQACEDGSEKRRYQNEFQTESKE